MKSKQLSVFVTLIICAAGGAQAQSLVKSSPGFHYFHKDGAGMERHDADLVACALATRALVNGSDATTGIAASTGGGLLPALVGGIIDSNEERQGAAANTENCMALHGWSVIGLSKEDGRAMEEPSDAATIHAKLAPLVEAPEPGGSVLRGPFANELAVGGFKVKEAGDLEEVSMSVRATRDIAKAAVDEVGDLKPAKPPKGVKAPKPAKLFKGEDLAIADPAKSYLVLRLVGSKVDLRSTSIGLKRLASDGTEVVYDGAVTATFMGGSSRTVGKGEEGDDRYYDYVVGLPPGMWKLATINYSIYTANLCFGAPAFELKQGETLFLGVMKLSDAGGYPLDGANLNVAKEILASAPALADKVKSPEFTNGFTSDCFGSYAYAYEIPDAPFVDKTALKDAAAASGAMEDTNPSNGSQADSRGE